MAGLVHRVDTRQVKLVLRMPRLFGFRMWLTIQTIRLAALIAPVTIEASVEHD